MKLLAVLGSVAAVSLIGYFGLPRLTSRTYDHTNIISAAAEIPVTAAEPAIPKEPEFVVTHIKTPEQVKGIYMTSWVAGTNSLRKKVINTLDTTEANAVIIDIKDYSGMVSFDTGNADLVPYDSVEKRVRDMKELIGELHEKNIYVIGRVASFQDSHLIKTHPEWAVKTASDKDKVWRDHKGIGWLDAGEPEVWKYLALIAHASYDNGFDEINFDYIRFPSDGNMKDIYYPVSDGKVKSEVIKSFFQYLDTEVRQKGVPTSADLFGMTATNPDDLGIGQILENAIPYFDYVCPMVYPSHFPPTWNGYANPATKPYEVINYSMGKAVERVKAMGEDPLKLRPWLQDFNLGATYTAAMVKDQIKATYDVGLNSWMLWDAANTYTPGALLPE